MNSEIDVLYRRSRVTTENELNKIVQDERLLDHFTLHDHYGKEINHMNQRFSSITNKGAIADDPICSKILFNNGYRPKYPKNHQFAAILSHDVDLLKPNLLRKFHLINVYKNCARSLSKKFRSAWDFQALMDLEAKYDGKSTFFFLACQDNEEDFNYFLDEIKEELLFIKKRGFEIALHGSLHSNHNLNLLLQEKKQLESIINTKIIGYRSHNLIFEIPKTWNFLRDAGFLYDSSLGFHDSPGFINGMCHPFLPYDMERQEFVDIIEIPITIMDKTIISTNHHEFNDAEIERIREIIMKVKNVNGVIVIIWHNTNLIEPLKENYNTILELLHDEDGWMTSFADLLNHD